jgi:hypothetical protein
MATKTLLFLAFTAIFTVSQAQVDSSLFVRIPKDTAKPMLNMDAVYNRPFLNIGKPPVSIGG